MYKLLLKKSFYDGWDNILFLFLSNVIFSGLIFGIIALGNSFFIYLLLFVFAVHLYGVTGSAFNMTRAKKSWFDGYVGAVKKFGHLVLFYFVLLLLLFIFGFAAPMYMAQGDILLYAIGFFLIVSGAVIAIAITYYYPLSLALPDDGAFKTLKKCFIVLFDNFLFSIYCVLKNICDLTISVFTALLMPGFTGLTVTQNNAVYFFMLRYDWMDEKKVGKHNVSADQYLAPLFEACSERSLKTLFFPWKNS